MAEQSGVVFPETNGRRSTSATGRGAVAAALRDVDPIGARAAEQETNWRRDYLAHFRRLVEAGLLSPQAARTIATDGLAELHEQMQYVTPDGMSVRLNEVFAGGVSERPGTAHGFNTATLTGTGTAERELSLPYRGDRLTGDALRRQLESWVERGVIEPSLAQAVRDVMANPDWLDLSDQRVVVLGAGAEMGPLQSLLRWGGDVVALDLPRPDLWKRVLGAAREQAGRLHVPATSGGGDLADRAGADLLHQLPEAADWINDFDGRLMLGNYVYADGATNVRVSMAVDALSAHLVRERPDTALAFLATPTDVFAVPGAAVDFATDAYSSRTVSKVLRRPLRVLSGGRLLQRNYAPGADPGICDSLVPQQGPNYVLAKRLQRWRATVEREAGTEVSFKVAPPTRTRSVLKNRALAAAYAGAHRFGIEVFEPATSSTLMAALLVHDLRTATPHHEHPWQDEAFGAAHGGLWRCAYDPRSALGLAVVLGFGSARV